MTRIRPSALLRTGFSSKRPREPEAVGRVADVRVVIGAAGRTGVTRIVAPRAAAQHVLATVRRRAGGAVRWRALIIGEPAILHPLGNAAGQVLEAERVGGEASDIDGLMRVVGFHAAPAIR